MKFKVHLEIISIKALLSTIFYKSIFEKPCIKLFSFNQLK